MPISVFQTEGIGKVGKTNPDEKSVYLCCHFIC